MRSSNQIMRGALYGAHTAAKGKSAITRHRLWCKLLSEGLTLDAV